MVPTRDPAPRGLARAAALSVILDRERSHQFEPAFGLRKLVDVATRSIYSSPFQDPTTSVQSINAIHDILRGLAPRERFPPVAITMPGHAGHRVWAGCDVRPTEHRVASDRGHLGLGSFTASEP